jgi:hypothetical protein
LVKWRESEFFSERFLKTPGKKEFMIKVGELAPEKQGWRKVSGSVETGGMVEGREIGGGPGICVKVKR